MKNRRIQALRGLLALAVILVHIMPIGNDTIRIYLRPFCNMAVAGFIFLSGYLTKLEFDTKKFYKKRLLTVLIPYIVFTIFYTVLSGYKQGIVNMGFSLAKNLITTQAKMTLYYLIVYMQLVLLTPLLSKIAKQRSGVLNVILFAIQPLFILCLYLGVINGNIVKEAPWYIMFFPAWILYYYLGLQIGNGLIKPKASTNILIAAVIVGVFLQIIEGLIWYQNTTVRDMYFSQIRITSLLENIPILLLIAKYICNSAARTRRFICKIGDASFGIYLLHPFFISVWDKLFARNNYTFLFAFVVVFVVSYLTVWGLNKIVPAKILKWVGLGMK